MNRTEINPSTVSPAPYHYAVRTGDLVWMSGALPLDPDGNVVGTTPHDQAVQAMDNAEIVLAEAGATLDDVVMVRTFVTHWAIRDEIKAVIQERFGEKRPPSTTLVIVSLGYPACMVEIEMTAVVTGGGAS